MLFCEAGVSMTQVCTYNAFLLGSNLQSARAPAPVRAAVVAALQVRKPRVREAEWGPGGVLSSRHKMR